VHQEKKKEKEKRMVIERFFPQPPYPMFTEQKVGRRRYFSPLESRTCINSYAPIPKESFLEGASINFKNLQIIPSLAILTVVFDKRFLKQDINSIHT
jgi:hypothetical protein